jgi:hypothetical protein
MRNASPGPAEGQTATAATSTSQTTHEPLAASLPNPPTTAPNSADQPIAKKQKVDDATSRAEIEEEKKTQPSISDDEDEFHGFADEKGEEGSHDPNASASAESRQAIEEGWEEVRKDEVGDAPVEVHTTTKDTKADEGEVDGQAPPAVSQPPPPNMLAKDW